jgi:hypothetical protein
MLALSAAPADAVVVWLLFLLSLCVPQPHLLVCSSAKGVCPSLIMLHCTHQPDATRMHKATTAPAHNLCTHTHAGT